tara:strand:+ start:1285 stop:2028 length:744 start_codon:yes stop_codon:yes gene_type:complete
MATVYTDNVLPETSGVNENITLGAAGDTVTLPTGVTLKNNTMKDSGGNTMFTSNGSGTLSSINSSFAGGGPKLLSTATASDSANLSFSDTYLTSSYKLYLIKFIEITPATNDVEFQYQVTTSGGNPNTSSSNLMNWYGFASGGDFGPVGAWNRTGTNGNAIYINMAQMNNATETGACLSGEMKLYSPAGVKQKFASTNVPGISNTDQFEMVHWGGMMETAVAITLITFTFSSGNITSGQIKLYGVGA